MGVMSDDKFEEFLQNEARSYNAPPATVPRDEMFAAIAAARRAAAAAPARRSRLPRYAWLGMAAALVIGVTIGKYVLTGRDTAAGSVQTVRPDAAGPVASGNGNAASSRTDTSGRASYANAANAELARAEALLTAYGASSSAGMGNAGMDRQLSAWARDILSNTRLLLDSPAAADPERRRLLQDLELVLVQMVQRSPSAGAAEERSHIDRSLERTQVLPRLRSALPAGRNNGI
jgi:hypothetical protein